MKPAPLRRSRVLDQDIRFRRGYCPVAQDIDQMGLEGEPVGSRAEDGRDQAWQSGVAGWAVHEVLQEFADDREAGGDPGHPGQDAGFGQRGRGQIQRGK